MRDDIAGPVYALIRSALDLKERTERGSELVNFDKEQGSLKELVRKVPNLGEERFSRDEQFLGIRYPLVCWLDEIFILDTDLKAEWTESSLEMSLYDSRDRAWKFWEQAQLAESRVSADALEVFFLPAMLGFRGDWHNNLEKLESWHKTTRSLLFDQQRRRWPGPHEVQPPTYVPPLTGIERQRMMLVAWSVSLLVLIPVLMYFLVRFLSS